MAHSLKQLNEGIRSDPQAFADECNAAFAKKVVNAAKKIAEHRGESRVVLLSGPSGSGKTTIALKIEEQLEKMGIETHTVSMDNYFNTIDPETAPRNREGAIDYESPFCLDVDLLNRHFAMLDRGETIHVPKYEFARQMRSDILSQPMRLGPDELAIFEGIHTLTIVGQIEGHQILPPTSKSTKYEHVMPLLAAVEESDDVDGLLVLLNTVGGDIEAGLGIAELISSMSKPTVSLVLGGGHSIGVPLAVSAKTSFIAPSAAMTIHPVRLSGTVIGVSQTFHYFTRIQDRITSFVTRNSHVARETFTKLMLQTGELAADVGSVIYGEEAVKIGLIDHIGGLADALECLHGMTEARKREKTQ